MRTLTRTWYSIASNRSLHWRFEASLVLAALVTLRICCVQHQVPPFPQHLVGFFFPQICRAIKCSKGTTVDCDLWIVTKLACI